jgi:CheY-like chemotaxis protein
MTPSRSGVVESCAETSDAPRARVLVVDDAPANLLALGVLLEGLDCDVQCESSGPAALSAILRDTFAVMLLDVRMPGMDGYEVARHVRMHSATRDLPIIFLTAESPTEEHLRLGYDAGAVDYLFKPLSREILRSKVRVFLELFASRRELPSAYARLEVANDKLLELVDEEAAASSALRQANSELGSALRASQTRIIEPAARPELASTSLPLTIARAVESAQERVDAAAKSLARLRERSLREDSRSAEREWQTTRAHLGAASHELDRLVAQLAEPAEKSAVFARLDVAGQARQLR